MCWGFLISTLFSTTIFSVEFISNLFTSSNLFFSLINSTFLFFKFSFIFNNNSNFVNPSILNFCSSNSFFKVLNSSSNLLFSCFKYSLSCFKNSLSWFIHSFSCFKSSKLLTFSLSLLSCKFDSISSLESLSSCKFTCVSSSELLSFFTSCVCFPLFVFFSFFLSLFLSHSVYINSLMSLYL